MSALCIYIRKELKYLVITRKKIKNNVIYQLTIDITLNRKKTRIKAK